MTKLYIDGGLAITRIILQRYTGAYWTNAELYFHNVRHRLKLAFHNYTLPATGFIPSNADVHMVDLVMTVRIAGAKFHSGSDWYAYKVMPRRVDGHPDFNDTLAPSTSRWFETGEFTWTFQTASLSSVAVQISTQHREIVHLPHAPYADLRATAG